ncbi:dmX-like 1 [Crotalus adamanteus]|uniref:DmX-like 1 n=1 Tax=Crotalus adamanteus TaxID=8729 RepID=A0AAW1C2L1_CROAD
MNLHQVLTGAVNPGDNCFSVGNVDGHPFTAYASGCDIVILGTDFERLQIIPGAKYGNIQVGCVDCSMQQGKIAAAYGNVICIFEPVKHLKQKKNHNSGLSYQWQNSDQICLEHIVHNLTWDPTGSRLLTSSSCLQLWSNVSFENLSEDENHEKADSQNWRIIWQSKTASQVHLMMFSPDGEFFATAGKDDSLVKVWYNTDCWKSVIASQHTASETTMQELNFSFIYLVHPRSVDGFSWRKTSNYMPRGAVCNVLLTCCKDNICRLWAETLLPNDSLLYEGGFNHWPEPVKLNNFKRNASSKESMKNALELNLRPFRRGRRRSIALAHTGYLPHQQDPHVVHRNSPLQSNALCHFHIAASINPATDIPLLPSIMSLSLNENLMKKLMTVEKNIEEIKNRKNFQF